MTGGHPQDSGKFLMHSAIGFSAQLHTLLKNRRNGEGGGGTPRSLQNDQLDNAVP